ncbi:AraC family transcriptional regulator [Clostridium cellulovorans]|uniref:Transcriptional regulator, AraC family n=1 Tax=Clostridium cellulovorans (strain ATCC 35296 / DSM 3052 / OCM 3 / 743B) TaxID=573061 RepID=D9SV45_CLOC7|nr:AraC family transcriptional regulator [Clostridium cellulovorans]ADL53019.1 transcriptional regulator, AraC family [Clostridium cellulovorans 743B]
MNYLFEEGNILTSPFEAFFFDTKYNVFPIKAHWHYFMEIIFMIKGTAIISCNSEEYVLESGDLILFHPQSVHSIFTNSHQQLKYAVLKFDINTLRLNSSYTPKLSSIFKYAVDNPTAPIFLSSQAFKDFPLDNLFNSCIEEVKNKDYGYDIRFQALISSLLIEILRIWRRRGFDTTNTALMPSNSDSLYTILQYIDEHSHESLRVEALAEMCHMSYSYFAKKFHELYGQSCKDYIEFIRISKVKDLLLFTSFDLNYISQETGFADCSHLIRTFKKKTGVTPKQFRMQHLIDKQGEN